jgi:hypothetical protein
MLLVQPTFEVVTVITVVVIGVILALYLIILRKNGWLGGNSDFYRCPNLKCKGIFQKPIELKDLSETPARVYPACPECGVDLESIFPSRVEKVEIKKVKEAKRPQNLDSKPMKMTPVQGTQKRKEPTKVSDDLRCDRYFGYLGQRYKKEDIPENCLGCPRITDCMLSNYNK